MVTRISSVKLNHLFPGEHEAFASVVQQRLHPLNIADFTLSAFELLSVFVPLSFWLLEAYYLKSENVLNNSERPFLSVLG